jgi:hypothetical protein
MVTSVIVVVVVRVDDRLGIFVTLAALWLANAVTKLARPADAVFIVGPSARRSSPHPT